MLENWALKLSDRRFNHLYFLLLLIPWRYRGYNLRPSNSLNLSYRRGRWHVCCCCLPPIGKVLLLVIIELTALNHEYDLFIGRWDGLILELLLDGLLIQLIHWQVPTRVGYHSPHEERFVACMASKDSRPRRRRCCSRSRLSGATASGTSSAPSRR